MNIIKLYYLYIDNEFTNEKLAIEVMTHSLWIYYFLDDKLKIMAINSNCMSLQKDKSKIAIESNHTYLQHILPNLHTLKIILTAVKIMACFYNMYYQKNILIK
jgi:hypothetical protein